VNQRDDDQPHATELEIARLRSHEWSRGKKRTAVMCGFRGLCVKSPLRSLCCCGCSMTLLSAAGADSRSGGDGKYISTGIASGPD